jgi:hypothetical protein
MVRRSVSCSPRPPKAVGPRLQQRACREGRQLLKAAITFNKRLRTKLGATTKKPFAD